MKINIEFPRKLLEVYNDACKPLCKKLKLPQTAFDILMFLGNNPQYQTARYRKDQKYQSKSYINQRRETCERRLFKKRRD